MGLASGPCISPSSPCQSIRGVGTVKQHWSAPPGEIIPNPIHEGVDFDPQTVQQSHVDAEPHAIGGHAFKLVAMLADLGYRGIPSNHRHDPFVMVEKWGTGRACNIGQNVRGCPPSALLCYRTKLRQSVSIFSGDISEVADRVDTREALDAKIVVNLDSPAGSLHNPELFATVAALRPAPQITQRLLMVPPSDRTTCPGCTSFTAVLSLRITPPRCKTLLA